MTRRASTTSPSHDLRQATRRADLDAARAACKALLATPTHVCPPEEELARLRRALRWQLDALGEGIPRWYSTAERFHAIDIANCASRLPLKNPVDIVRCKSCATHRPEQLSVYDRMGWVDSIEAWESLPFDEELGIEYHENAPGRFRPQAECPRCACSGFVFVPTKEHAFQIYIHALQIVFSDEDWVEWLRQHGWVHMYLLRSRKNALTPCRDYTNRCMVWTGSSNAVVCGPYVLWDLPEITAMTDFEDYLVDPPLLPWGEKLPMGPSALPDKASEGYPTPWRATFVEHGRHHIYDAEGSHLAHIHCWSRADFKTLEDKLLRINQT